MYVPQYEKQTIDDNGQFTTVNVPVYFGAWVINDAVDVEVCCGMYDRVSGVVYEDDVWKMPDQTHNGKEVRVTYFTLQDSGNLIDYDKIQTMIDDCQETICDCNSNSAAEIKEKVDLVDSGLKQVIREVTEEVNENQTFIEELGFKVTV